MGQDESVPGPDPSLLAACKPDQFLNEIGPVFRRLAVAVDDRSEILFDTYFQIEASALLAPRAAATRDDAQEAGFGYWSATALTSFLCSVAATMATNRLALLFPETMGVATPGAIVESVPAVPFIHEQVERSGMPKDRKELLLKLLSTDAELAKALSETRVIRPR